VSDPVKFSASFPGIPVASISVAARTAFPVEMPLPSEVAVSEAGLLRVEVTLPTQTPKVLEMPPPGRPGQSAYAIAVADGFVGTVTQWLASLQGADGDDAYAVAVAAGFVGTRTQWLASLQGGAGDDAYTVAVSAGFVGTCSEWLASLQGADGSDAYQVALSAGFAGTRAEWLASLQGADGSDAYQVALSSGFAGTRAEWLASLKSTEPGPASTVPGPPGSGLPWLIILASEYDALTTPDPETIYDIIPDILP